MNDVMLSPDKVDNVFLLLLDLSAAYDTVNHFLLLSRLKNSFGNGISGSALRWRFQSYLADRPQFVVTIENAHFTMRDLSVGIPQGCVLGPILYLLYPSPLAEIIKIYDLDYHLYADDS